MSDGLPREAENVTFETDTREAKLGFSQTCLMFSVPEIEPVQTSIHPSNHPSNTYRVILCPAEGSVKLGLEGISVRTQGAGRAHHSVSGQ